MTSNSAISKVFRQIAFLIEFEAKGNENKKHIHLLG
jgi:hypothetical protein